MSCDSSMSAKPTTHEQICNQALKHYEEISHIAKFWCSTVPLAIEFYREHGPRLEEK